MKSYQGGAHHPAGTPLCTPSLTTTQSHRRSVSEDVEGESLVPCLWECKMALLLWKMYQGALKT